MMYCTKVSHYVVVHQLIDMPGLLVGELRHSIPHSIATLFVAGVGI